MRTRTPGGVLEYTNGGASRLVSCSERVRVHRFCAMCSRCLKKQCGIFTPVTVPICDVENVDSLLRSEGKKIVRNVVRRSFALARRIYPGLDQFLASCLEPNDLERILFEQAPVRRSFSGDPAPCHFPPPQALGSTPPHAFYRLMPWLYRSNAFVTAYIAEHSITEGLFLYEQCRKKCDGTLVEVGRRMGGSTLVMASALNKGKLYSLDIRPLNDETIRTYLRSMGLADRVELRVANSAEFRDARLTDIDLLFLDGNKEADAAIAADLTNFLPLLSSQGMLLMHDMNELPVQRAVERLRQEGFVVTEQVGLLVCLERKM